MQSSMRTILYSILVALLLSSCTQSEWKSKADKVLAKAIDYHKNKMDDSYAILNHSILDNGNKPYDVEVLTSADKDMVAINQQLDSILLWKKDGTPLLSRCISTIKKNENAGVWGKEIIARYSIQKEKIQSNPILHELIFRDIQSHLLDSYTMQVGSSCLRFTMIYPVVVLPADTLVAGAEVKARVLLATSDNANKKIEYFANGKWHALNRYTRTFSLAFQESLIIPYRYKKSFALFHDTLSYFEDTMIVNTNLLRCP
jgi:hypothetical protein